MCKGTKPAIRLRNSEDHRKRNTTKTRSNGRTKEKLIDANKTNFLSGQDITEWHGEAGDIIEGWIIRIGDCGTTGHHLWACPDDHHSKIKMECCRTPICAFEQARYAAEWTARANKVMKILPGTVWSVYNQETRRVEIIAPSKVVNIRWGQIKRDLAKHGVGELPHEVAKYQPSDSTKMSWKFITVNLRTTGNLKDDLERLMGKNSVKRKFSRYLQKLGSVGHYISLDVGAKNGHCHLHALALTPWIDRETFESWHRGLDCTIAGCKHPAGSSPDVCNGSFESDIRAAWDAKEAMKYTCTMADCNDENQVERFLAVHLYMYKKHRVDAYGLCRKGVLEDVELEIEEELDPKFCPECGQELVHVETGFAQPNGAMVWHKVDRPPDKYARTG